MYHELNGKWAYQTSTGSGTLTLPAGAVLLQVLVHSSGGGGTVAIFGGGAIATPANDVWDIRFLHDNVVAQGNNTGIVFTGLTTIFAEYIQPYP